MRRCLLSAALAWLFFAWAGSVSAQFGSFGDVPVSITADGATRFEAGVAIAEDNVQIHYGDYSIYCDYAEYNPDTRDVLLIGNIRLYTPREVLTGQRALFNLETKQMRGLEFSGAHFPLCFAHSACALPQRASFESGTPSSQRTIPPNLIFTSARKVFVSIRTTGSSFPIDGLYRTPIFWFPYIFASISNTGFEFLPGFYTPWGAYLLSAYSFPIGSGDNVIGKVHLDARSELGAAVGFDAKFKYGKDDRSYGDFISYYADDTQPDQALAGEPPEEGEEGRYRVTFKHRLFLTDDIYATADVNLLSDVDFLEDYFPGEFRIDPQPDTFLSLTKWDEFYTLTLLGRWQINDFQDTTERLPELVFDSSNTVFLACRSIIMARRVPGNTDAPSRSWTGIRPVRFP